MAAGSSNLGLDPGRLARVREVIEADLAEESYDGAVVLAARRGEVALHEAVGYSERSTQRRAALDDVFHFFSISKTMTAVAVMVLADRGALRLTDPVANFIPEFAAKGKQRVTVGQLIGHTGGIPPDLPFIMPQDLGNTEAVALAVAGQALIAPPGQMVSYSPIGAYAVLAEVVRRVDGCKRSFRQFLDEELFGPLGMKDTCLSLREDLAERRVPLVVRDRTPAIIPPEALESINVLLTDSFEMPGASAIGTAADLFRWGEALRRGGELDGARILSPAMLEFALRNHTGTQTNRIFDSMCEARGWDPYPANLGYGFFLRGSETYTMPFGLTASSGTFGGLGAGSTMFWVDPQRELVFVCLTSGTLEDSRNFERMQKLSDLVLASVVD
jgi:CubicO group peptidase (beta-lactamase class C family)